MIKKSFLLILFLVPLLTYAQSKAPGNMYTHILSNGLTVLVIEDNSVPLATLAMTFKNGAYTESSKISGYTGIYSNMIFKANKDYGDEATVSHTTSVLGMSKNAIVSQESAIYYFTLPSINVEQGLKFMNSAIQFPILDEDELQKQKSITDEELTQKESGVIYGLSDAMNKHLWGSLANRKTALGNHANIQAATLPMLDSIRRKYYYPNNALLTVAGKVSHTLIFAEADKIYESWQPSAFNPFKKWIVPEFNPLQKNDYFIVESVQSRLPYIMIKWQGPDTRNDIPSTYAADVFSYIVTQHSSALNKALVESGLALQTNFSYLTLGHGGEITFVLIPNPQKIKECFAEVKRQLTLFDDEDYITDEQIQNAKRKLEIKQIRESEITSDFVRVLSFWWASANLNYYFTYHDKLQKVTKADLQAYIRKYIKNKPYCAGLVINPDMRVQTNVDSFFIAN